MHPLFNTIGKEFFMLKSLKGKILVPSIGIVVVMLIFIVAYMSRAVSELTETLSADKATAVSQTAMLRLSELKDYSTLSASNVALSETLSRILPTGNRDELYKYLEMRKNEMGIYNIVVTDNQGIVVMRTNAPANFGDSLAGAPNVASALRGQIASSFSPGALIPMAISTSVPIYSEGTIIGVVVANFSMATSKFVDEFSDVFKAEVAVFAENRAVASTQINGQRIFADGFTADPEVTNSVLGRGERFDTTMLINKIPYNAFYFPLNDADGKPLGMFFLGFSEEYAIHQAADLRRDMIIISAIGLVALGIVVFFYIGFLTKPLKEMTHTLGFIATGDLTVSIPQKGKITDEIGESSRLFNQTIEKIKNLVISIKNQAVDLSGIGNDLASNMNQTASAMNEITTTIQSIKIRVMNQGASVIETNATMEQVTGNIDTLNGHIERQIGAVSQASTAIEEMLANIHSVTATLVKNSDNVRELQGSSASGRSSLNEVASDIKDIARESEGLLEINSVMANIASQTNLLSMNAAIEAAHAGESGKGFAVVADEIRKLAESSGNQLKTIRAVLKKIKTSIDKISHSTESALTKFEVIDLGVKTVAAQGEEIREAMEDQSEGSRQVLSASQEVSDITQYVKGGSLQMLEGSREVIQESKNLEVVTQEITDGISEMSIGADEVNKAVNNANELSGRNRESIDLLVQAVSQFKVMG